MPQFTYSGKAKDWEEQFKKEFGHLPESATLDDVVANKASTLGKHVDSFIKEKANEQKNSSSFKHKVNSESNQTAPKGEKENV
jgi:hypothetical protein